MNNLARLLNEIIPQGYYVGGIVRSSLLKRFSTDIDIALPPEDVKTAAYALAKKLKAAVFEMDPELGVWRLVTHKEKLQIDLTAYQGKDLKADLLRRDFAFNALAYPVSCLPEIHIEKQKNGNADRASVILTESQARLLLMLTGGCTSTRLMSAPTAVSLRTTSS